MVSLQLRCSGGADARRGLGLSGARLGQPELRKDIRPFFEYGMFALWNNGASTVAKNLDFVMVGALLGLAAVPRYTFAFFIATVVSMPLRAMSPILRSLTSKAVAKDGAEQSGPQLQQAARVQLAVTAALLVAIVAGMPALDLALPENYQGLRWVVLAVGMAFVAEASGGTAGPILQFSERYKLALPINLGLVVMTLVTNYAFMQWLGWGIEGAALATGLTGVWNMGWRTSLMWRLFRIHPSHGWFRGGHRSCLVAGVSFAWTSPSATLGGPPPVGLRPASAVAD